MLWIEANIDHSIQAIAAATATISEVRVAAVEDCDSIAVNVLGILMGHLEWSQNISVLYVRM